MLQVFPIRRSGNRALVAVIVLAVIGTPAFHCAAECIPMAEARQHIGETKCVSGRVIKVETGNRGVTFLDFCEDFKTCPFTAVVFRGDLKQVGDVRQLKGQLIEIKGTIQNYDGRAEIIVRRIQQFGKGAAMVPPLPKDFDVERRGKFSAGKFSHPNAQKTQKRKKGQAISIEDPAEEN